VGVRNIIGKSEKEGKRLDPAKPTETLRMIIEGGEVRIKTVGRDEYAIAVSRMHQGRESIDKQIKKQIK